MATTVRYCSGRSFLRIADLRSSEYRAIENLKSPTRDEFRRNRQLDNYGDMVGIWADKHAGGDLFTHLRRKRSFSDGIDSLI